MSFADLGEVYGTDFVSNVQKRQQKEKQKQKQHQNQQQEQQKYDVDDDNLECNFFLDHIEKCEKCRQILKNKFSSEKKESPKPETFRSKKKRRDNSIQTKHNNKLLKRQLRQELKGKIDPDMLKELDGYDYDDMSNYLKIKNTKGLYVKKDPLTDCLACDEDEDNKDVSDESDSEDGGLSVEGFENYSNYDRRRLQRFLRRKKREIARLRRGDGDNDIIILILLGVFTIFAMDSLLKIGKKIKN
jgi:hypothetical protein